MHMKKNLIFFKSSARFIVQLVFFLYSVGIGFRFYFYYRAVLAGNYDVIKPAGVEAFLPISALVGLKQLLSFGVYDTVHPAGLTIFLAAIFMSALFKKSFCGYICPVGFVSERLSSVGFGLSVPRFLHYPLLSIKYILLAFFFYLIFYSLDSHSAAAFIRSPYNKIADAKMMLFFMPPSFTASAVIGVIILLTLLFKNFWCRYLCPYGALLGLFSLLSPFKIKRSTHDCISCGACSKACPMDIDVKKKGTVFAPECIGCMNCIKARYSDKCLSNGFSRPYIYALSAAAVFFVFFMIALIAGFWQSSVTNEEYGRLLSVIDTLSH